jgi:hypothetical protein
MHNSTKRYLRVLVTVGVCSLFGGCGYYSFTGASVPSHLNTIAIPTAEDNTASPITTLSDELTRRLTERLVGQTRLSLQPEQEEADAVLISRIDRYTNQPAAVGAQDLAELNRVTITVSVTYMDQVEDQELLQRSFSSFADYNPAEAGLDGEVRAVQQVLDDIADDIFTAATSNW